MSRNLNILKYLVLLSVPVFLAISGCSKCEAPSGDRIVAYVNKEPVFESELNRNIAVVARQQAMFKLTPEAENEELDNIINKKILIQEAMNKGLAREPRFINTIKNFWEQTLIRDFVDYKQKEFQEYVFVTDEEVNKYYETLVRGGALETLEVLRPEIESRIIDGKENQLFEDWFNKERARAKIKIIKK